MLECGLWDVGCGEWREERGAKSEERGARNEEGGDLNEVRGAVLCVREILRFAQNDGLFRVTGFLARRFFAVLCQVPLLGRLESSPRATGLSTRIS